MYCGYECGQPHAPILAGDTPSGGDDEVVAYSTNDGKQEWRAKVNGSPSGWRSLTDAFRQHAQALFTASSRMKRL